MKIMANVTIPVFKYEKGTTSEGTMVIHRREEACADSLGHILTLREMGMNEKITKVRSELFSIKAQG